MYLQSEHFSGRQVLHPPKVFEQSRRGGRQGVSAQGPDTIFFLQHVNRVTTLMATIFQISGGRATFLLSNTCYNHPLAQNMHAI